MRGKISEECLTPNKSKTYLLPLTISKLNLKYIDHLENTFLFVRGIDEEPIIALLYEYTDEIEYDIEGDDGFIYYVESLKESRYFIKEFELGDYSLFVFKLPEELNYAYGCLIEGKYSWLTPEQKKIIIMFLNRYYPGEKVTVARIIGILNRSKTIKQAYEKELGVKLPADMELSSRISIEAETIDPDSVLIGATS